MQRYEPGDYVKFEIKDDQTGASEWLWLRVDHSDEEKQLVFGRLDSQPVVFPLSLSQELAVSFPNIRQHKKPSDFLAAH